MTREHKIFLAAVTGIMVIALVVFAIIAGYQGPTPQQTTNVTAQAPLAPQTPPSTPAQPGTGPTPQQPPPVAQQPVIPQPKPKPQAKPQAPPIVPAPSVKPAPTPAGGGTGGSKMADLISKQMPTMVDFGAEWCPACKQMRPIVDQISKEYAGRVAVVYIDLDKNKQLAANSNISAIPTQIFFDQDGHEVSRHVGVYSKEEVIAQFGKMGVK